MCVCARANERTMSTACVRLLFSLYFSRTDSSNNEYFDTLIGKPLALRLFLRLLFFPFSIENDARRPIVNEIVRFSFQDFEQLVVRLRNEFSV